MEVKEDKITTYEFKSVDENKNEEIMTVWNYIWSISLLSIPIVGIILAIIWSINGICKSINKRNMARAFLIIKLCFIALIGFFGGLLIAGILYILSIQPLQYMQNNTDIQEFLDKNTNVIDNQDVSDIINNHNIDGVDIQDILNKISE